MMEPFRGEPITVRLLDIGGDKRVATVDLPHEENPFLGVRGVRLLQLPHMAELLQTHLRSILIAGEGHNLKVMIPMVSDPAEIAFVRERLVQAHRTLDARLTPHHWPVTLGIMAETPAVAFTAARYAREADFFSVGTNDLTQYVMAAERGNGGVSGLYDSVHPAVVEAIRRTVEGAHGERIEVSVCGEMASDRRGVEQLLACGVDALSVSPAAVASTKELVRRLP